MFGVLSIAQVYAVALLSATAFVFSDAAVFGAVPALVGPQRLAAANGLLASISSGAEILGPVLAGVLVATIGPAASVSVDAASFLVAAAVLASIGSTFRDPDAPPAAERDVRAGVTAALRFIRGNRTVATLLGVGFGNSFAFGAVLGLTVPYAVEALGLSSDDGRIGALYGAVGVGSLVSGLLFARVFRTGRVPLLTPLTIGVSGAIALALALTTTWLVAVPLFVGFALSMTTTITVGITYRQLAAPDDLRSSVNVIGRMVSWGGQPFGAATGALLASASSVPAAYTMAAVVMAVSAAVARLLLRGTSTETSPPIVRAAASGRARRGRSGPQRGAQPSASQLLISLRAIEIPGGMFGISSRRYQLASAISLGSSSSSPDTYRARKPIIRLFGNGQGWLPW